MDNFFEIPLLQNDLVFEMENKADEFNPEYAIKNIYEKTLKTHDGKTLVRDMFYVDMFSFNMLDSDEIVYWMPAEHPISELLQYYNHPCLNRVEENCIYGDVIIYKKESVDWCIDMIINK